MPSVHSKYSPSSSHIWSNCLKSLDLLKKLPKSQKTDASIDGDVKHKLMEKFFNRYNPDAFMQMDYRNFLIISGFERGTESKNLYDILQVIFTRYVKPDKVYSFHSEIKLTMDNVISGCFGTCDLLIESEKDLFAIDWKFGFKDVAADSTQLLLYAIGAYNIFSEYEIRNVYTIIVQPKRRATPKVQLYTVQQIEAQIKILNKKLKSSKMKDFNTGPWCSNYARCSKICALYKEQSFKKFKNTQKVSYQ